MIAFAAAMRFNLTTLLRTFDISVGKDGIKGRIANFDVFISFQQLLKVLEISRGVESGLF